MGRQPFLSLVSPLLGPHPSPFPPLLPERPEENSSAYYASRCLAAPSGVRAAVLPGNSLLSSSTGGVPVQSPRSALTHARQPQEGPGSGLCFKAGSAHWPGAGGAPLLVPGSRTPLDPGGPALSALPSGTGPSAPP